MKTDRREFLKYGLITSSLFVGSMYSFNKLQNRKRATSYSGDLIESSGRGHTLRQALKQTPIHFQKQPVLIVGAGMTGLITGYYLKLNGFTNFKILELNSQPGGNSQYGENAVSKFPWGAHYVPLPNKENKDLVEFLKGLGLADKNTKTNTVEFKDEYLCQDPQERLLIKGDWQESLLPGKNILEKDHSQLARFHKIVEEFKYKKGRDGKFAFSIPVMHSSQDAEFLNLDSITFDQFLINEKLDSSVVRWYLNYCVLDDYGMGLETVSAWAGLHYFCSRRPVDDYDEHKILTWPEGNGWILDKLQSSIKDHIEMNQAVLSIKTESKNSVLTSVYNFESKNVTEIECEKLVFSAPQFLLPYLMKDSKSKFGVTADDYYSWLVANVTVRMTREQLNELHWDNVQFQSNSLGYVHARHQSLRSHIDTKTVLTLYWPLFDKSMTASEVRKKIANMKWQDWAPRVEAEFESMHPGIASSIEKMDIKIYGHAMIGPRVGRMKQVLSQSTKSISDNIYYAHTDNSGMSLFEEAHYWGLKTAKDILANV